jgi:peptidyl-prolyl cis-trans isomerase B (cyclophilin B)
VATGSKRERELARAKYERQQAARAERSASRRRTSIIAAAASVLVVILGIGSLAVVLNRDDGDTDDTADTAADTADTAAESTASPSAEPTPSTEPAAALPCTYTAAGEADRPVALPVFDAALAAQPYTATIVTTQGDVTFQARTDVAPCASYSFRHLAEQGFYDGTPCPRVTSSPTFGILQCGDPTGTGSGGPGYSFPDENLAGATYPAGTVAMANSGPNTNGSQFFLVFADTQLSPDYIPFGTITAGLDVLQRVGAAGDDGSNPAGGGKPVLPIDITDVVITPTA